MRWVREAGRLPRATTALFPPMGFDELRIIRAIRPYTMVGFRELRTIYRIANTAIHQNVPGAFVECGSASGGTGALLARIAKRDARHVWLFDSWKGMPQPRALDGEEAQLWSGRILGQEALVYEALQRVQADRDSVHVIKGWFDQTLVATDTGPIALLHLDGDWYESIRVTLESLYDRVVENGFLIVDDYGLWPGCKQAVDEFFSQRAITPTLRSGNRGLAVWFRKPVVAARV